jgi:hypothetical protein
MVRVGVVNSENPLEAMVEIGYETAIEFLEGVRWRRGPVLQIRALKMAT